ncbi:unnamed protein product, partial [Allacma fusca]
ELCVYSSAEHVTSPEQTVAITREKVFSDLIQDKNKVRILPKEIISFKTRPLGSPSLEEVTIENNGEKSVTLTRILTGKTQDVAKFEFIFEKGVLNPEDFLIELLPHKSWTFGIKCSPVQLGRTKELLIFQFGSFRIGRWLWVHSVALGQDEIIHGEIQSQINRKMK